METSSPIFLAIALEHTIFRKGITKIISSFTGNYEIIIEAGNGHELINKIEQSTQLPEICIIDLNTTKMNGFEVLYEMRLKWPDIKILVITSLDNEHTITKLYNDGANGYLGKDSEPDELEKALKEIKQKGHYYSASTSKYLFKAIHEKNVLPSINKNETTFLGYCGTELSYKQIAYLMGRSVRTVEGYRDHLFQKLNKRTRVGLVMYGLNVGLVGINQFQHEFRI